MNRRGRRPCKNIENELLVEYEEKKVSANVDCIINSVLHIQLLYSEFTLAPWIKKSSFPKPPYYSILSYHIKHLYVYDLYDVKYE